MHHYLALNGVVVGPLQVRVISNQGDTNVLDNSVHIPKLGCGYVVCVVLIGALVDRRCRGCGGLVRSTCVDTAWYYGAAKNTL